VESVVGSADVDTGGEVMSVDGEAARLDLTRLEAPDWGGHAQGFVDAGAEVGAGVQAGAGADLLDVVERGADFLGEAG
jgi:hypothetical protein